jgi:hypothetical protein
VGTILLLQALLAGRRRKLRWFCNDFFAFSIKLKLITKQLASLLFRLKQTVTKPMAMCASSAVQGGLKSKKIVYAYQARLNAVQHCRSIEDYVILQADATSVACKAIDFSSELYFESHCYMGDATHQEAIDLEKIHIGVCSSFAAGVMAVSEAMGDNGCLNVALFNPARTSAVCDLQIQSSGTSEYTYKLMMSELASVGCPSWEDRAREAYLHPSRFSLYAFGLDKGQTIPPMPRELRRALRMFQTWPLLLRGAFCTSCISSTR